MKDYTETQMVDGAISRKYNDGTYLVYHKWDSRNIYIKLLHSTNPGHGVARKHLLKFLNHRNNKNFYVYVSNELGADLKLLKGFYEENGFKKVKKETINGERVNYIREI